MGTETLRRRGKEFTDELRHEMMGQPAPVALRIMIDRHGLSDTVEELAAEGEELFWRLAADELQAMPAAKELLDWLDDHGAPRGIATSGGRSYAERLLDIVGLAGRFAFLITADDIEQGKPHPEPYLKAAKELGVEPQKMLVLEDSANGCRSGVASGAYTVAVPNRHTAAHDFAGAAFVADSLADSRIRSALGTL